MALHQVLACSLKAWQCPRTGLSSAVYSASLCLQGPLMLIYAAYVQRQPAGCHVLRMLQITMAMLYLLLTDDVQNQHSYAQPWPLGTELSTQLLT